MNKPWKRYLARTILGVTLTAVAIGLVFAVYYMPGFWQCLVISVTCWAALVWAVWNA